MSENKNPPQDPMCNPITREKLPFTFWYMSPRPVSFPCLCTHCMIFSKWTRPYITLLLQVGIWRTAWPL